MPLDNTKGERSGLLLKIKRRDSLYSVEGSNGDSDCSSLKFDESYDSSSSEMTEPAQDTSFDKNGDAMLNKSDELNTPNISPEKENTTDFPSCDSSFFMEDNPYTNVQNPDEEKDLEDKEKVVAEKEDPEPPVVIKKEQPENGDLKIEETPEKSDKADDDGEVKEAVKAAAEEQPTDNGDCADDDSEAETVAPQENAVKPPAHPVITLRRTEDLMISRPQVNGNEEKVNQFACGDCPGLVFPSAQDLGQHQAANHQSSVQQLAQQVQRIPAQFQSPAYRVPTPPQRTQYLSPPPHVPYYPVAPVLPHEGTTQTIGSGVVLSTVTSPAVPNLPPGIQLSKRPAAQPPESSAPKQRREEHESRRLPDSITLSRTPITPPSPARNSVTDMLANRGITVVPSGRSSGPQQAAPAAPSLPRSLSSAISITPSSTQRQSNFAVPAPKQVSRLLTVDLTKESDVPPRRVMQSRGRMRAPSTRSVCQICDKAFPTPQELQQHMACHRAGSAPNKLAYECRECTAQYPTEAGLQAHRQKYHGAGGPSPDMAIPVVDLKQVGVLSRLAALGIRSVIPLSQLHSGTGNGLFGLPVVAVDAANNPAICNIGGLGASNLLPLGPLKNLTFNR